MERQVAGCEKMATFAYEMCSSGFSFRAIHFLVRRDWESVELGAGVSLFGGSLVAEAGEASDGVVSAVPVGESDACMQLCDECGDFGELVVLA